MIDLWYNVLCDVLRCDIIVVGLLIDSFYRLIWKGFYVSLGCVKFYLGKRVVLRKGFFGEVNVFVYFIFVKLWCRY